VDNFWIIGGGKFGLRAAKALSKQKSVNNLTIVEQEITICRQLDRLEFKAVCMDGIQYLERNLIDTHDPDWIIPAIPVHVAYEWIRTKLSANYEMERITVPNDLIAALPNPIKGKNGQLYISIADFKCPEGCLEPDEICTHTGKPRLMILHEFLKSIRLKNFKSIVIRSHQLAPGVGGYKPEALFEALKEIKATQAPLIISTACSCHGVVDAFKYSAS
jgi:hypothetical protein